MHTISDDDDDDDDDELELDSPIAKLYVAKVSNLVTHSLPLTLLTADFRSPHRRRQPSRSW